MVVQKNVTLIVSLKHLSNFWKTLEMPLINCEINFILTWSKECLITTQKTKFSITDLFSKCDQIRWKLWIWSQLLNKSVMENFTFCAVNPTSNSQTTFAITDTKRNVTFVTLSTQEQLNNSKSLQQLKLGFKRTINWNKYQLK